MKSETHTPDNPDTESTAPPSLFKKISDSLFEEVPNRDMSKETYEENIQRREALIRKHTSKYILFIYFAIIILVFSCFSLAYYWKCNTVPSTSYLDFYVKEQPDIFGGFLLLCGGMGVLLYSADAYMLQDELSKIEAHIYAYERFVLRKNIEEDMYESSIQMSYKYLDQYYHETREQATRGFRITVGVCVIGAAIVIIGVVLMVFKITTAAYVTTASGVIIEFISSIFFHLYNKTIQSMGNYHNKLILSQNVAIALKISDSIEGPEKNTVKVEMIKALTADINNHINSNKPSE